MHTHYLGTEEVEAYLRDLAERFRGLKDRMPTVWVLIGPSGIELGDKLVDVAADLDGVVLPVLADYDREQKTVVFKDAENAAQAIAGKDVLVLDSSVHSGSTMYKVVAKVLSLKARAVCSYTLVLKQGASFIPSFWAVTIGDHDRAYFLLEKLPNNHFLDCMPLHGQVRERPAPLLSRPAARTPYFHVRKLLKDDIGKATIKSGLNSLDRAAWSDRLYEMQNDSTHLTYVLEADGEIRGFLTVVLHGGDGILSVEAVAVDHQQQGKGYGAALIRWAETVARHSRCRQVRLWGIEAELEWYKKLYYRLVPEREMDLDNEKYYLMSKRIISHV